ncbi:MAG: serine/threonine protein kinase [Geodermatophilaceae bacterium]|nr:serine/threonine protein kinase [Geodermatophilaceae bacterium]
MPALSTPGSPRSITSAKRLSALCLRGYRPRTGQPLPTEGGRRDFPGYEVLGRVAAGTTGVVWKARQSELDRLVAIKELSPALLAGPGFLQRFRAEAQMLAVLDDPHVVRVFDYVEEPDRAYLVQEWVDGAPLTAVLAQHGTLTPEQALGVLRGGLIGLAHAHSRGLVHRDVSPANILLDRGGTSKLVDFGLTAQTDQGIAPGAATSVGTPAFSSPEAVTGAPMTTRSDVYSAAAVLYLLLSGRLPYSGDVAAVLNGHTSGPLPRLEGHGPELADLLARGMAKNPAERPPDAAAFLAELERSSRYPPLWRRLAEPRLSRRGSRGHHRRHGRRIRGSAWRGRCCPADQLTLGRPGERGGRARPVRGGIRFRRIGGRCRLQPEHDYDHA